MTRRELLKISSAFGLIAGSGSLTSALSACGAAGRWKIGACDWSLNKGGDPAAFEVAKQIGLDGVQVSLGSLEDNMRLRQPEVQASYKQAAKASGLRISSLAIGELNGIPYKSDPRAEEWVHDSIDVAHNLGVEVILLAFFSKGDLRNDEAGKREVISRLKKVASKAEKQGVTLGLETYLSAEELMDIIQKVGSKSIKVYYDFRNSADAGYDVLKELDILGKERICELHMKENGFLLGEGTLDWPAIARKLREINYKGDGWMQIEWAHPAGANIVESYKHNLNYLNKLFNV